MKIIQKDLIIEKERFTPIRAKTDVVVAGGGPAGFATAIASARNGAETLLIERYGFLGGMITAGLVTGLPINLLVPLQGEEKPLIGGVAKELVDRLTREEATIDPIEAQRLSGRYAGFSLHQPCDPEVVKYVMQEMALEAGVKLLLHTFIVDAVVEDGTVKGVIVENKSGRQAILAKLVVDATGDGDVAASAGATFEQTKDSTVLPVTITWYMNNVDTLKAREYLNNDPGFSNLILKHKDEVPSSIIEAKEVLPLTGRPSKPSLGAGYTELPSDLSTRYNQLIRKGQWRIWGPHIFGCDITNAEELTEVEVKTRRDAMKLVAFLKKYAPGFENAYLALTATHIGIRESRRIIGGYQLTHEDIFGGSRFKDVVARSRTGERIDGKTMWTQPAFDIPYRCLVPRTIDGLLVSGRCISLTHEAAALLSPRDLVTCFAIGQATGTAAFMATKENIRPRDLTVSRLQKLLSEQGANLGIKQTSLR